MTNIFKTDEKVQRRDLLKRAGLDTLRNLGWSVTKEKRGQASVRRIRKDGESKLVSIRTTQDQWIAFPPKPDWQGWETLDDVDVVLAVSVDNSEAPKEALVHWLDATEVRERFNVAAKAREKAGRRRSENRGLWIPLYRREPDNPENVSYVGGGLGLDHPPIARVPLLPSGGGGAVPPLPPSPPLPPLSETSEPSPTGPREIIAAAKRSLAAQLAVPESSIKISIDF